MSRHLIVADVETNGLNPDEHVAFEVAWWNLATDERGRYVPPIHPRMILATAEPAALRVNRYIDRLDDLNATPDGCLLQLWEQFAGPVDSPGWVERHTLAGVNPAFDARFIPPLFERLADACLVDDYTPWHHRLFDVSAYAAGVLGLDELPGLARVCELLDVPPPDLPAEGDVTATGLCIRALQGRAKAAPLMCAVDDFEPPAVHREATPIARKPHRCGECLRRITPGEQYRVIVGLWDDGWSQHRQCRHCVAAAVWMDAVCGGYCYGGLFAELVEHWHEGYRSVAFGRLIAGMRYQWHAGADPVPEGVRELATAMTARQVAS